MSGTTPPAFRQLILELSHAGADPAMLRAAAEFARLLGLHLHGVFVEDEALLTLAEFPFAREIRLPTHEWAPLSADKLAAELRHAAEQARRSMQEILAGLEVPNVFEVLRGDPLSRIAELCCAGDIMAIAQPAAAAGLVRLPQAAHDLKADVLLLPEGLQARDGPVVAVVRDAADPALDAAARIADKDGPLLVLVPSGAGDPAQQVMRRAQESGLPPARVTVRLIGKGDTDAALSALGRERERLIVVGRADSGPGSLAEAARIASARATPVLVADGLEGNPRMAGEGPARP